MEEDRHKRPHIVQFHLCEMSRIGKPIDTKVNYWLPGGWGRKEIGVTAKKHGAYFWRDGNALELDRGGGCTQVY